MSSSRTNPVLPTYGRHTPGPWWAFESYGPRGRRTCAVASDDRSWPQVARVYSAGVDDRADANARLIAAAPDLLEALKALRAAEDALNRHEHEMGPSSAVWQGLCDAHAQAWDQADAAIAKATPA